jgi:hypothetical protein
MNALAQQQQALLNALFEWPAQNAMKIIAACAVDPCARGLKAYQTNGHMLAERALQAAYPVVAQLIGDEGFADLARALWHAHPPTQGDLALWGDRLPAFLHGSAQLQDEPYLPDVARSEWVLHCCASAPDDALDAASLALLTTHDPDDLAFRLAPGCCVVSSAWPIFSLLAAHLQGAPTLAEVGAELRAQVAQDVVIWRKGLRAQFRLAQPGELRWLERLMIGSSIGQSLADAPGLDFATWLPLAIETGLVLGVAQASLQAA